MSEIETKKLARPALHSPDQTQGNIALLNLFPNPAFAQPVVRNAQDEASTVNTILDTQDMESGTEISIFEAIAAEAQALEALASQPEEQVPDAQAVEPQTTAAISATETSNGQTTDAHTLEAPTLETQAQAIELQAAEARAAEAQNSEPEAQVPKVHAIETQPPTTSVPEAPYSYVQTNKAQIVEARKTLAQAIKALATEVQVREAQASETVPHVPEAQAIETQTTTARAPEAQTSEAQNLEAPTLEANVQGAEVRATEAQPTVTPVAEETQPSGKASPLFEAWFLAIIANIFGWAVLWKVPLDSSSNLAVLLVTYGIISAIACRCLFGPISKFTYSTISGVLLTWAGLSIGAHWFFNVPWPFIAPVPTLPLPSSQLWSNALQSMSELSAQTRTPLQQIFK